MKLITAYKRCSLTKKEAEHLLRAHVGERGICRVRSVLDWNYRPVGKVCSLSVWKGIGDEEVIGEGASWRKAFENAGVFLENGVTYEV